MNQTIFEKYTKTYGKRFTRKQKHKFEQALTLDMEEAGYKKTLIDGKRLLVLKAEDYFYGNTKRMKTVIVVPYDTPEKKFWHKVLYYPFNGTKTMNKSLVATYVPLIILYVFILAMIYGGGHFATTPAVANALSLVMFVFVIFLVYMMLHGIGNKHNMTRYSGSVVAAVELAKQLDKDEKQRVAFLFTDKNKANFFGAKLADDYFTKEGKNPNVICLDCLSTGSVTKIGFNPSNRKLAMEVAKEYPDHKLAIETVKLDEAARLQTPMSYFRKAIVIASGELDEQRQLYVLGTGTKKDSVVDEKHIDQIVKMLDSYIKNQK